MRLAFLLMKKMGWYESHYRLRCSGCDYGLLGSNQMCSLASVLHAYCVSRNESGERMLHTQRALRLVWVEHDWGGRA